MPLKVNWPVTSKVRDAWKNLKILLLFSSNFAEQQHSVEKSSSLPVPPTNELILRFIGNFPREMGFALAEECASRGAEVVLITGPTALSLSHPAVQRIDVESALEMYETAIHSFPDADAAILSAAVADYRPKQKEERKIKRKDGEGLTITLTSNPDIAAALGKMKRNDQLVVGFALETDNEEANALRKMEKKQLNHIVLNSLRDKGAGFGHDTNKVTILSNTGEKKAFKLQTKRETAKSIINTLFPTAT